MKFYQCDCDTLIHEAQIGRKESSVHKFGASACIIQVQEKFDMKSQDYFNYRATRVSLFVLSAVNQLDLGWFIQLTV